ncbi:MAG: pyridoxal 5'-phosphate synthase glutaminase subunit PdxT [Planctomycetota bacterium]
MVAVVRAGVLAVQGSFAPHAAAVRALGVEPRLVRRREHFEGLTHLVMPGGESTTFRHLMDLYGLIDPLVVAYRSGLKILATCAGAILLGRENHERPRRLGLLDAEVLRNAYGRQVDSFSADIGIPCLGGVPFHAIFIRAPKFLNPGPEVEILARAGDAPVLLRQGRILAAAFHPELTDDRRLHRYFLENLA